MYRQQCHTFHNLTHLELELIFEPNWHTKWKWLVEVLEHCPKLQNPTLHEVNVDKFYNFYFQLT